MKKLILGIFFAGLLGLVSVASAGGVKEPTYDTITCWVSPPESELWYPCGSEDAFMANCIRLMEIQMKRIDPYLPFIETGTKFTPEEKRKYDRAISAWNQSKHDCWKEFELERQSHLH